jgi:hypothetical protein
VLGSPEATQLPSSDSPPPLLRTLAESLKTHLIQTRTLHAPIAETVWENLPAWSLDTTVQPDLNTPLRIREKVLLAAHPSERLHYATQSQSIEAEGLSGYLKSVSFSLDLKKGEGQNYSLELSNSIQVEKPWYALSFLFVPIARSKAIEKFEEAERRILTELTEHLKVALHPLSESSQP